jgi:16S rRNA (cytosine967-C5)-methyltransferase
VTDRDRALKILERVDKEGAFAAPLIDAQSVDERSRRLLRTLVLGVLRWRSKIDFLIERISGRRIARLDRPVVQILRLGFFQLLETDVPPHAAVNESVELARCYASRSRGLINAVLRKASSADLEALIPRGTSPFDLSVRYGHPEWMVRRWIDIYGSERTAAIARANQEHSHPDLIVNTGRIEPARLLEQLKARGVEVSPSPLIDTSIRLRGSTAVLQEEIAAGLLYPMDDGSAAVASVVPHRDRRLLDLAAAPGGKSLYLGGGTASLVANDISIGRLALLGKTWPAWFGSAPAAVVSDGRRPPFRQQFDSVLLDAPCSATGTIRRSPEIRWRLREDDLSGFASLQRELLASALALTASDCIYSTCSLEPEENEQVVRAVLDSHPDFELARPDLPAESPLAGMIDGVVLRILPDAGCDGFTVHRLRRRRV